MVWKPQRISVTFSSTFDQRWTIWHQVALLEVSLKPGCCPSLSFWSFGSYSTVLFVPIQGCAQSFFVTWKHCSSPPQKDNYSYGAIVAFKIQYNPSHIRICCRSKKNFLAKGIGCPENFQGVRKAQPERPRGWHPEIRQFLRQSTHQSAL